MIIIKEIVIRTSMVVTYKVRFKNQMESGVYLFKAFASFFFMWKLM
jgi:hypothetical protein